MASPDQIKSSSKLLLAIGGSLTTLALGIGIPTAIGTNAAGRQTTARIASCAKMPTATSAVLCVESVTGRVPFGMGVANGIS
jgi:hypothetical protein